MPLPGARRRCVGATAASTGKPADPVTRPGCGRPSPSLPGAAAYAACPRDLREAAPRPRSACTRMYL
jgi:hypothetical protein